MQFLEQLRTAPQSIKSRYAFAGALTVTLVVGFIWSTTLPARFSEIAGEADTPEVSNASPSDTGILDVFENIKDGFAQVSGTLEDEVEISGGVSEDEMLPMEIAEDASSRDGENDGMGNAPTSDATDAEQPAVAPLDRALEKASSSPNEQVGQVILIGTTTRTKPE